MSKDEFVAKHLNETVGLLLGSFAESEKHRHKATDETWAADGKFMISQMTRAKALLGRMYDDLQPTKEKKP